MLSQGLSHRSRHVLPGAGGALSTFYLEPEPKCSPGTGVGTVENYHSSISLVVRDVAIPQSMLLVSELTVLSNADSIEWPG